MYRHIDHLLKKSRQRKRRQWRRQQNQIKFRIAQDKTQSLGYLYPEIAAEWHTTRNGELTPFDLLPSSEMRVWWLCSSGHEWFTHPGVRIRGHGCPYCAGTLPTIENCLAVVNPDLAKQWDYEKNGDLTPYDVLASSGKKVWWICSEKNHEFPATIDNRNSKKSGCPYCSGRKVCMDNCLATVHPDLAMEWDDEINGDLTPYDVTPGQRIKVGWKCRVKRHTWKATINSRTSKKSGCPYCVGKLKWYGE